MISKLNCIICFSVDVIYIYMVLCFTVGGSLSMGMVFGLLVNEGNVNKNND
jgi:hypothetical protein